MSEDVLKRVYQAALRLRDVADFQIADCIGYGGPLDLHRDYRNRIDTILQMVPTGLVQRWDREDREAKAFALEEQAKALRMEKEND